MSHKLKQIDRYMKINRKDLKWFMRNIRHHSDGKELNDEELVEELAMYMERNPGCVDIHGVSDPGRFHYLVKNTVWVGLKSLTLKMNQVML